MNTVPKLAASVIAGVAIGGGAVYGVDQLTNPDYDQHTRIARIDKCAQTLGSQAVLSEKVSDACDPVVHEFYSYTDRGNRTYLLPSADQMKARSIDVPRQIKAEHAKESTAGLGWGFGVAILTFALLSQPPSVRPGRRS